MLVDLNQKFVDADGVTIQDIRIVEGEDGKQKRVSKDLMLSKVVNLALTEPDDPKISGDTKIKCFNLLLQVIANKVGMVELESTDVAFIKDLIKPKFTVLIVGEAMRMLEGKDIGIVIIDDKKEPESEKIDPPEGVDEDKPDLPYPELDKVHEEPVAVAANEPKIESPELEKKVEPKPEPEKKAEPKPEPEKAELETEVKAEEKPEVE